MTLSGIVRTTALLLIPILTGNNLAYAARQPMNAAAIKAKLEARGVGHKVRITLKDKTDVRGAIVSIGEDQCVLESRKVSGRIDVSYANVVAVHNDRGSMGKKIGIGAAIGIGALVVVAVVLTVMVAGSNTP